MNAANVAPASRPSEDGPAGSRRDTDAHRRRQFALITLAAGAIFVGLRLLPTGTNLNHMDFRVDAKNAIEFCDPSNPQFIPVVAVRSPVTLAIATDAPAVVGREVASVVTLRTANGKPLAPEDLLVAHTRKLHLLLVDPTLRDYQHVHPDPAARKGEWRFSFTPQRSGTYRVFADFTPAATGRGLYASVDVEVAPASRAANAGAKPKAGEAAGAERGTYGFALEPVAAPMRAGRPIDLRFTATHREGGPVPLEPVMGAFAHLVAFDETRSGFAHLHPAEVDLTVPPDRTRPTLNFKLTIPTVGRYVIWAQVNVGGEEMFVPFWFDVV